MLCDHKVRVGRGAVCRRAAAGNVGLAAMCLLAAVLSTACAGLKSGKDGGVLSPKERTEKPPLPVEECSREDDVLFRELPAGIRAYLRKLEAAFAAHDAAFLLAQGEGEYEMAARNRVNCGEYLAMLYRAGRYADDAVWEAPSEIDSDKIACIKYTAWREQGPVLGVDGKIYPDEGRPILFSMKVLWRLNEPKLLGVYP
jgi:hypothetical protein